MEQYFFANYRLLTDINTKQWTDCAFFKNFESLLPHVDTFTLKCVIDNKIDRRLSECLIYPLVVETNMFEIRKRDDGAWIFQMQPTSNLMGAVLYSSVDYGEMKLFIEHRGIWIESLQSVSLPRLPLSSIVRCCIEPGIELRGGIPMHASLVSKNGEGVLFLGPSGMGKSTQAKLWKLYLGADFIIGDRPVLRFVKDKWFAFGMPWDGKDGLRNQRGVPIRGIIVLEQASTNYIRLISKDDARIALFYQAIIPVWDNHVLDKLMPLLAHLSLNVPFYRLSCLPNQDAVMLAYKTLFNV